METQEAEEKEEEEEEAGDEDEEDWKLVEVLEVGNRPKRRTKHQTNRSSSVIMSW